MPDAYVNVRRYPMLRFASHVDWKHMNTLILNRLNTLGSAKHQLIFIFSGYRSDTYSDKVGGFKGDPHTRGIAADARVGSPGGKYIGTFFSAKVLAAYGLRSGNTPNFYKGKPDPEHVDLIGFGFDQHGASSTTEPTATPAQADVPVQTQATQPAIGVPPQTQAAPELSAPPAPLLPGTVGGNQSPVGAQAFWKRVVDQPGVSAETQQYAGVFQ